MPRGLWKGAISLGLVNVPVELVSGEKRSNELHFTMLDKRGEKAYAPLLMTLRYADELRKPGDDMSDKWWPEKFRDTYRADILKRVKEKVKAGQTEEITESEQASRPKAEVIDLMAALKKSVSQQATRKTKRRRAA